MAILTKVWQLGQGNLLGLERKAPDYFSNLSIFEIEKCFLPPFGSLGLQFLLARIILENV